MFKKVLAVAAFSALSTISFCRALTGQMTWVSGTLVNSITVENTRETIVLQVGDVQDTLTNTYVTGLPGHTIAAGTPMMFMDHGSTPFSGQYMTSLNMTAFNPADGKGPAYRRTVPITSAGALAYSVATIADEPGSELDLYMPVASLNWAPSVTGVVNMDGLELRFGTPMPHYSISIPTPSAYSLDDVIFPSGSSAMNTISFSCQGNCQINSQGASTSNEVSVVGNISFTAGANATGNTLYISGAVLSFLTGQ